MDDSPEFSWGIIVELILKKQGTQGVKPGTSDLLLRCQAGRIFWDPDSYGAVMFKTPSFVLLSLWKCGSHQPGPRISTN